MAVLVAAIQPSVDPRNNAGGDDGRLKDANNLQALVRQLTDTQA